MNFSLVCRTCLSTDSLNPIFKDGDDYGSFSNAVHTATGVQVHINDNMPQNICSECVNLINVTLKFREQCKNVENKLVRIKSELKLTSDLDIKENTALARSQQDNDTNHSNDIDSWLKVDLNNVVDIKQEDLNETLLSTFKTEAIKIRKKSLDHTENEKPDSFNIDCKMDIKKTKRNGINGKSIKKSNMRKKSETENALPDIFYNDNETNINDNVMKTDNEQFKLSRRTIKKADNNISLDEIENGISISFYEINESNAIDIDNMDSEEKEINNTNKLIRKSTKKIDLKSINDNREYTPHKRAKVSNNETVGTEKMVELPYSVLPDVKDDKIVRVVCKMCGKELSIRSIDSHMNRCHPGADERKVKCELCDKHLLREKLNRHMTMIHGGSYRCGYCKSEFDSRPLLLDHVQRCTAKNKRRRASESGRKMTECDECQQKMQKASLRMHKATKHAGLRPVCEHCGKSFGNKLRLSEHCRAKHGYEKLKCSSCEFASASVVALRNHERRHRGEKPFVCESCGAKFHAAYLLAQHRHSHRTEKTVKCDLCPAMFKANNSLHMHKLTCHSKCVYKCGLCARAYRCRHYALKHLRHVHAHAGDAPPLQRMPSDVT